MRAKTVFSAFVAFSFFLLASCAWMRDSIVDQAAGFPASHVISDVKSASDEYQQEKHDARVDELNSEYEEFLRSRETVGMEDEAEKRSVVIKQENDSND
ncbi:MAG: hypothetical protein WBN07_06360 [Woeseiaceae bacterium]